MNAFPIMKLGCLPPKRGSWKNTILRTVHRKIIFSRSAITRRWCGRRHTKSVAVSLNVRTDLTNGREPPSAPEDDLQSNIRNIFTTTSVTTARCKFALRFFDFFLKWTSINHNWLGSFNRGNYMERLGRPYKKGPSCGRCKGSCKLRKLCTNSCSYADLWVNCRELNTTWNQWLCHNNSKEGLDRKKHCRATCECTGKIYTQLGRIKA